MAGGGETTRGRASGEQVIAAAFAARGVEILDYREGQRGKEGRVLLREYPFVTLYQTPGRIDFVMVQDGNPAIAVEVKHQGVSGSVDEKIPYVILNGLHQWPVDHGILVLSGEHWASARGMAAIAATRQMAQRLAPDGRRFDVFDMRDATNWIAKSF